MLFILVAGCAVNDMIDESLYSREKDYDQASLAKIRADVGNVKGTLPLKTLEQRWGFFNELAGKKYLEGSYSFGKRSSSFEWVEKGLILEYKVEWLEIERHQKRPERTYFWYDPVLGKLKATRTLLYGSKGSYFLDFQADSSVKFFDSKDKTYADEMVRRSDDGYAIQETSFLSGATVSAKVSNDKEIAAFVENVEWRKRAAAEDRASFWGDMATAFTGGVAGGAAIANADLQERQMQQNRERSAQMAAQSREAARQEAEYQARAAQREREAKLKVQRQSTTKQSQTTKAKSQSTQTSVAKKNVSASASRDSKTLDANERRGSTKLASNTKTKTRPAGSASTDSDANMCISGVTLGPDPNCKHGNSAAVVNNCPQKVDARICIMTTKGKWNCGVVSGIQPGQRRSYASCFSTGRTFVSARSSSSNNRFGNPPGQ